MQIEGTLIDLKARHSSCFFFIFLGGNSTSFKDPLAGKNFKNVIKPQSNQIQETAQWIGFLHFIFSVSPV